MPSSARPRSLIISSTSSVPTESRTRFFRAKDISYTSFSLKCTKRKKKEITSFSDANVNTIGFSHNCMRRTLRISRYSLAGPDTVNIPPSQLVAWIETNLLYVVRIEKQKKKNTYVVITDIRLKASTKSSTSDRASPKDNTLPKPLLRKSFFAML